MGRTSTIGSRGQVTIPLEVRSRLGVKAGDKVLFDFKDGLAILRPAQAEDNPFARYAGSLHAFDTVEESNAWLRDLRGHDPDEL
jgi:AbrB family looped-hinge helix DNA binding protein